MRRKLKQLCLCSIVAVLLAFAGPAAYAVTSYGDPNWEVKFTDKLESNFQPADMA